MEVVVLISQLKFYLTWLHILNYDMCMAKSTLQNSEVNFAHCMLKDELIRNHPVCASVCGGLLLLLLWAEFESNAFLRSWKDQGKGCIW